MRLGEAVRQRKRAGQPVEPELVAHISPLVWARTLLTAANIRGQSADSARFTLYRASPTLMAFLGAL